jgi:hypothetical protein
MFFISCSKDEDIIINNQQQPTTAVVTSSGDFVSTTGYSVLGKAKVYTDNNVRKVVLENFSISSGPDLKVYLSKTNTPVEFVSLGNLASNTNFSIPSNTNLLEYKYVIIHCQQFNKIFATA